MIPKIIHLCWLSGEPYPDKISKCISTWKKHLPDYEIMLWDTNRFDISSTIWTKQAFEAKKYAFVADYVRFYAVYNYGGIYFDSDVEVLKSFDDLLSLPYFIGKESNEEDLEVAVFGAEKGTKWVQLCLEYYQSRSFINADGSYDTVVCPKVINKVLNQEFKKINIYRTNEYVMDENTICILPMNWFCAHSVNESTREAKYLVTPETYSVHHFAHSWWGIFPGGPLHKLYYKITGKDWHQHYYGRWDLIQK